MMFLVTLTYSFLNEIFLLGTVIIKEVLIVIIKFTETKKVDLMMTYKWHFLILNKYILYLFSIFKDTYYPSSSKNFATTFGAVPPSKSSFIVFGSESNDNTSAGQCSCPHLIQITFPALNLLSVAIFKDDHELSWCQSPRSFCSTVNDISFVINNE